MATVDQSVDRVLTCESHYSTIITAFPSTHMLASAFCQDNVYMHMCCWVAGVLARLHAHTCLKLTPSYPR